MTKEEQEDIMIRKKSPPQFSPSNPCSLLVIRSFLLFPTIERMSESPKGKLATPFLCWFRYAFYVPGYLLLKPWPEKIKSLLQDDEKEFFCIEYIWSPYRNPGCALLSSVCELCKNQPKEIRPNIPIE
eukprot:bmy_15724T0